MLGILRIRLNENVDIAGRAGSPVKRQGITAYDEVINLVRVE